MKIGIRDYEVSSLCNHEWIYLHFSCSSAMHIFLTRPMQTPLNALSHPIYFTTVAVATLIPSARDNPQNYVSPSRIYICFFF